VVLIRIVIVDEKGSGGQIERAIGAALVANEIHNPDLELVHDLDAVVASLEEGDVNAVVVNGSLKHLNLKDLGEYCLVAEVPLYLFGQGKVFDGITNVQHPSEVAALIVQRYL